MRLLLSAAGLCLLLLTGCSTLSEVKRPFAPASPQSRYYGATKDTVFEAMLEVLADANYTVEKREPAVGIITANGNILETGEFGVSRQYLVEIRVRALDDTESSVEILIFEAREISGAVRGSVTKQALGQHGRYTSLFEMLQTRLGDDTWLPPLPRTDV